MQSHFLIRQPGQYNNRNIRIYGVGLLDSVNPTAVRESQIKQYNVVIPATQTLRRFRQSSCGLYIKLDNMREPAQSLHY